MRLTKTINKGSSRCLPVFFALWTLTYAQQVFPQQSVERSWTVLKGGLADKKLEKRAVAVRVLGLLNNDPQAPDLALKALEDRSPEVRAAAADALGQMMAKSAAPKLAEVILRDEKDVAVILSCAHSMIALGDDRGYGVYYAVLTGERKSGGSLLEDQRKMLSNPKRMAQLGFEQGIGFIPYGGLGYAGFKMLTKDDLSPIKAVAASVLMKDPDSKTHQALIDAASDKSWVVRMAAIDSLARRGHPDAIPHIEIKLDDPKDVVRYTAAAAIIRLSKLK